MFSLLQAWLIPHLIANNLASVLVTNIIWWTVLVIGWLAKCMCDMDVAMSFLILASVTTMAVDREENDFKTRSSSCWKQIVSFFSFLLNKLKEKQSGKLSMILEPGRNSGCRGENKGKILYTLLFESTRWPLTRDLWQLVRLLSEAGCWWMGKLERLSINVQTR